MVKQGRNRPLVGLLAGMAGLVLIALAAFFVEHRGIVDRLGKAVDSVAEANYLYDVTARIEGSGLSERRTIILSGVSDKERQKDISRLIGAVRGVHTVRWEATDDAPPIVWHVRWDGRRIQLNGKVAAADWRTEIENTARRLFPNAEIRNDMQVVAGKAIPKWPRAATIVLEQLAQLDSGDGEISGSIATVLGVARSQLTRVAITRTLDAGLPSGYTGRTVINLANASQSQIDVKGSLTIPVGMLATAPQPAEGPRQP